MNVESYHARALDRARTRLADHVAGRSPDGEVGRSIGATIALIVFVIVPLFVFLALALYGTVEAARSPYEDTAPMVILAGLLALGLVLSVYGTWRAYQSSDPTRPAGALSRYYKHLAKGQAEKAQRLVLSSDFDEHPRYQPLIPNLGPPSQAPIAFWQPGAFASYWNQLLRHHTVPYCYSTVSRVQVSEVDPGLAVVDFQLKFVTNTSLVWLAVLVSPIIAIILDLATRKRAHLEMTKVLVRVGSEWHLLSGELRGPEEWDLSWLPAQGAGATSPYRGDLGPGQVPG